MTTRSPMHGRPTTDGRHGSYVTTPRASMMMQPLGVGIAAGSVALTGDELAAIRRIYGFTKEPPNAKPAAPLAPKEEDFQDRWAFERAHANHEAALKAHASWTDPRQFMQAGADLNAIRAAEVDGLRLLAWLARYVPPGADPLKHLVQAAADAGWDVDPADVAWADDDDEADDAVDDDAPIQRPASRVEGRSR